MSALAHAPGICWRPFIQFLTMLNSIACANLPSIISRKPRLEAETKGRVLESDEMISAALDAVARDYFARALLRAVSPEKALARVMERRARGNIPNGMK